MPKQWMYVLAFIFVGFFIYQSPLVASGAASDFAGVIGTLITNTLSFLESLFSGGDNSNSSFVPTNGGNGVTGSTISNLVGVQGDSFGVPSN